jgi:hypothetical protein
VTPDIDWTAVSTIVALALGLLSLWFGHFKPAREQAVADATATLEVRWECFWRRDTQRMQHRLVVHNIGPHTATDVGIATMATPDGSPISLHPASTNPLPVAVLQPAQEHHTIYDLTLSEVVGEVTLRWNDGHGENTGRFALSPHYV